MLSTPSNPTGAVIDADTQKELAERADMLGNTLSAAMKGSTSPRLETLEAIADALSIPVAALFLATDSTDELTARVETIIRTVLPGILSDYVARATTPGKYIVPPTKAEEMYMPETFGRAASDRVVVE